MSPRPPESNVVNTDVFPRFIAVKVNQSIISFMFNFEDILSINQKINASIKEINGIPHKPNAAIPSVIQKFAFELTEFIPK